MSAHPYFSFISLADHHLLAGHKSSIPYLTPDGGSRVPVSNNEKRGAQGSSVSLPVITKQFGIPIILPLAEYEAPGFRACGAMTFGGVVRGCLEDRHIFLAQYLFFHVHYRCLLWVRYIFYNCECICARLLFYIDL